MKQIWEEADVAVKNVSLTYLDKNGTSKNSSERTCPPVKVLRHHSCNKGAGGGRLGRMPYGEEQILRIKLPQSVKKSPKKGPNQSAQIYKGRWWKWICSPNPMTKEWEESVLEQMRKGLFYTEGCHLFQLIRRNWRCYGNAPASDPTRGGICPCI